MPSLQLRGEKQFGIPGITLREYVVVLLLLFKLFFSFCRCSPYISEASKVHTTNTIKKDTHILIHVVVEGSWWGFAILPLHSMQHHYRSKPETRIMYRKLWKRTLAIKKIWHGNCPPIDKNSRSSDELKAFVSKISQYSSNFWSIS